MISIQNIRLPDLPQIQSPPSMLIVEAVGEAEAVGGAEAVGEAEAVGGAVGEEVGEAVGGAGAVAQNIPFHLIPDRSYNEGMVPHTHFDTNQHPRTWRHIWQFRTRSNGITD